MVPIASFVSFMQKQVALESQALGKLVKAPFIDWKDAKEY
ncbi:unnamed protein product, partial [Acanthoscelides obtectus]